VRHRRAMLSSHRHTLVDESHGRVTLLPWLGASQDERGRAFRANQALAIVERWRRKSGRRGLVQVASWLAADRAEVRGLNEEGLVEQIRKAVRAHRLIALPGWVEAKKRERSPLAPVVEVVVPRAAARKEATADDAEPTIRLVNLESRHFVPGKETVRVSYAIDGPVEKAASVKLVVKSRQGGSQGGVPLARLLVRGPYEGVGETHWDGHLGSAEELITLAESPYHVHFELMSTSGHRSISHEVEIELEVHSVSILVDALDHLPVADRHKEAVKALADELAGTGLPGDSSGRVILDAPVFPIGELDFVKEMGDRSSAEQYARYVGSGIRVPLVATIRLKSKTGKGRRAPAALRGSRLDWFVSYQTKEEWEQSLRERGATDAQIRFLIRVAAHEEGTAVPSGAGIHRLLGGRRSAPEGEAQVAARFWRDAGGWGMEPSLEQPWTISTACGGPTTASVDSAVYFVSGRIAGDTHRIHARIASKASRRSFDGNAPEPPKVDSNLIALTNWRRVRVVGDWFVGDDERMAFRAIADAVNREFAPAAVLIEMAPDLPRADARRHWKREYRDTVDNLIEQGWPFLSDALETDSGHNGREYAVRFRPYADFLEALGTKEAWALAPRRLRDFFLAPSEVAYRRRCDDNFYDIFHQVAATFELPEHGLTLLTFNSRGGHNQEDATNDRGGFFGFIKKLSGRHRALVAQFAGGGDASVTVHEIGHALFLQHAPGHANGVREPGRTAPQAHDKDADCLMAYTAAPHFCGLCLLKLAGADYTRIRNDGTIDIKPDDISGEQG
jgi:hypothetical protein